ncbi:non-ribosomal peptide synthetase [Streptomyces muensis]|uniref:Amino acid adenylation domain-containing protein n=1 Tax=Streptomyces muensis TaxID=1077944 RepID=A0A9X1TNZ1_STRM4|nr:non-ribosomal peptide synthetase [Streptomyces muensis]MCF1597264.1 amino acid adenylation domain-containing protein [Streptomyces muensis]
MNAPLEHQSWISVIASTAATDPGRTAFTFSGTEDEAPQVLTYGRLDLLARATASRLQREGATGRPVVLLQPPGLDYVVSFVACLYAGAVAVPVYPPTRRPRSVERLAAIVVDSGAALALTTARIRDRLLPGNPDGLLMETLRLVASDLVPEDEAAAWTRPDVGPDTLAFLQYTSGSTATPRGVLLTHGNLLHNSAQIQRAFRTTRETVGMSWLPLFHDMGLIGGMLQPLYYAGSCALMSPAEFSRDPLRWLREISRSGATVSGGPNFAYDLCADLATPETVAGLDLGRWEVAFNGAEPIRARTQQRFAEAFAPAGFRAEAFTPCYGLAEATLIVSCKPHGTKPVLSYANRSEPSDTGGEAPVLFDRVSSGRVDADQRLEIVDPVTLTRVEEGAVGEIWLSGPSVAQGYWNRPEHSERTFRARLADAGPEAPAFLRTGDLGLLRDGELFVTGRLKDLLVVRGRNHYPQDIERTVEATHPALRPNCGAAVQVAVDGEDHVVVVHEVSRDHQDGDLATLARDVRNAVAETHGVRPLAVVLIRAATLPRTSSGKVQRHVCAASYLDGSLTVLAVDGRAPQGETGASAPRPARPTDADVAEVRAADAERRPALVLDLLRTLVSGLLEVEPDTLTPDLRLSAAGLDSLGAVRLRHELRGLLGVDLEVEAALGTDLAGLAHSLAEQIESGTGSPLPAEDRAAGSEPGDHPLSRNQSALWFLEQVAPGSAANLISCHVEIRDTVDPSALEAALALVSARHAALRSTFPLVDDQPVQRVHAELPPAFEQVDAAGWSDEQLTEHAARLAEEPLDLLAGPLLRVRLLTQAPDRHRLVLTAHHLVSDLWSLSLLFDELDTAYPAALAGTAPELPEAVAYPVFTHRQSRHLASPDGERRLEQWVRQLADAATETTLPADRTAPAGTSRMRGAALPLAVDDATTRALTELARDAGTTLYGVLLAAFQVLLARSSGRRDVVVGTPVHGRSDADLAGTVGCLVNTVPLRADVDAQEPFLELLRRVHGASVTALGGDDVPFATLVERLSPVRDRTARPMLRTMFTFQQAPGARSDALVALAVDRAGTPFTLGGLDCRTAELPVTSSQFDIHLTLGRCADGLVGSLRYDTDLYSDGSARLVADRITALLAAVAADATVPVGELPVLGASEQRLLDDWNATDVPYAFERGVVGLIEKRAATTPDALAVVAAGSLGSADSPGSEAPADALTYGRLDRLANGLAHRLRSEGIGAGAIVAVLMERTPVLPAVLLGVLKSGAMYLPLDPALPPDRLAFLLEDASAAVILTERHIEGARVLAPYDGVEADRPPAVTLHEDSPAYVIYTSGSTGKPKGVLVPHRGLTNLILAMGRDLSMTPRDGWLTVTTPSFDIAALDYYLPLVSGATLHIADAATAAQGARLRACLDGPGVTRLQATPVTWQLLLDAGWKGTPGLSALCGGERMPAELTRELPARGAELWNMYGPTETTVWSLRERVTTPGDDVPLGRPLSNTRLHVLDEAMRPVPLGTTGELHIGGDGLAHGYLRRPGLTADRFVPDPFSGHPGARLYRTGDLVRMRPDGRVMFVGRADTQVKVHGHRIELGEIESTLERLESVRRAAVIVDGTGSDARLAAYVEPAGTAVDPGALREALKAWLPPYAVPSVLTVLETMPLTASGKVDRRALPDPDDASEAAEGGDFEAPRGAVETKIAEIASGLLPQTRIGRGDDLFDLGAHSLMMSRLVERVRSEFGTVPPLRLLFETPTVAAIAAFVEQNAGTGAPAATGAGAGPRRVDRSRYRAGRAADGALRLPAEPTGERR